MAESAIWVKVFPSTTSGDTGGPGWDVLTATAAGPDVVLSWPAAGGSPAGYEIVVDGQIQDVGNVLTKTVTGLATGVEHTFKVRAYDAGGLFGGWSSEKKATPLGWNAATGGTITDVDNYNGSGQRWRVHKFTSNGSFDVSVATGTFRWLVTGGGGGCGWTEGGNSCGGGNAASASNDAATIAVGSHAVTVGAGGANGQYGVNYGNGNNAGGNGGTTVFGSISTCGGGQGGPYNGGNVAGGSSLTSDITGASVVYCNGPRNSDLTNGAGSTAYTGSGPYSGPPGGAGVVIVAYRIG